MPEKEDFPAWLERQLAERGWLPYHLAKKSGLGASTILNLLSGERKLGPDAGRAMAKALELPEHVVFLAGGLLTEAPPDLGGHPIKATIAREIGLEDDPNVLASLLEVIRAMRGLGGSDKDAGKKAGKVSRLPLAR
jgi:hypothetical protein